MKIKQYFNYEQVYVVEILKSRLFGDNDYEEWKKQIRHQIKIPQVKKYFLRRETCYLYGRNRTWNFVWSTWLNGCETWTLGKRETSLSGKFGKNELQNYLENINLPHKRNSMMKFIFEVLLKNSCKSPDTDYILIFSSNI